MEYKELVKRFLTQELFYDTGVVAVEDDEDLLISGLVDSLGMMRLITFIEGELGLRVPPADVTIDNFLTVNAIAAYIERRLKLGANA